MGWAVQGQCAPGLRKVHGPRTHTPQVPETRSSAGFLLAQYMSLRELVEATLHGRDERLVAKCNVPAILQVLER